MTWGQLRFSLQTAAPGVSLDLIDGYLNNRYEQVLGHMDWQGLKAHASIVTTLPYQNGVDTAILTVGSGAVTLTGRSFTSSIVGMKFYRPGDKVLYTVDNLVGPSAFTLDRPYEGPTGTEAPTTIYSASSYVLMQNVYALPTDCASVVSAIDPVTGFPLHPMAEEDADESWGPRTRLSDPQAYAVYCDSDEQYPPVVHRIEFFPPPLHARGIKIEYRRAAFGFDGGNTGAAPLPWIPAGLLLEGCKADIAAYQEKMAKAEAHEAMFEKLLAQLALKEESQVKTKRRVHMAARFTRHRAARVLRGQYRIWGPSQGGPN